MNRILRSHLPHTQAHILAGVLASGGIPSVVTGDLAAHLYGGIPAVDCAVMVPEEDAAEAEVFLKVEFSDEPPNENLPVETCPPDGELPGVGVILYGTVLLAPLVSVIPALLAGISLWGADPGSPFSAVGGMIRTFFACLLILIFCLPIYAIGAGLLMHIIRGYRRGSWFCWVIVAGAMLMLVLALVLTRN